MSGAHPCLDRAERVLDSLSPDTHHLGHMIKPYLHLIENSFVLPARYATLGPGVHSPFSEHCWQFELQYLLIFRPRSIVQNRHMSRSPAGHLYSLVFAL
ncbi:hypothetical protein C8K18_106266 [Paraburkholderia sp. GV068]|nr:hypothetical protein C8K19_106266 [Paraburkholderia sp. GV072]PUB04617.1 hypothetical protein C8K18_106266 [Paraburkholderia sp. GV068]